MTKLNLPTTVPPPIPTLEILLMKLPTVSSMTRSLVLRTSPYLLCSGFSTGSTISEHDSLQAAPLLDQKKAIPSVWVAFKAVQSWSRILFYFVFLSLVPPLPAELSVLFFESAAGHHSLNLANGAVGAA